MKITTIDKTVADLIKEFLFIPRFQRPYDWEREHVDQFWKDTIIDNAGDYFIGSVVLYKDKDAYGIVDGQQRITTIVMMLCAIRNVFAEHNLHDFANAIQAKVERVDFDNKKRFVLFAQSSHPYLQSAVLSHGQSASPSIAGNEIDAIQEVFQMLQENIRRVANEMPKAGGSTDVERAEANLKVIRDRLLGLKLISIELDNEDDAYVIFETLNTRGKDLDTSHLLKNHLSKLLKPANADLDSFKLRWSDFIATFESSQVDIDVDAFLHHRWLSVGDKYLTANKLYPAMKKAIDNSDAAIRTVEALCSDAELYRAMVEPDYRQWSKEERLVRERIESLLVFRVKQPYPLVLAALRAYESEKISKKNLESVLWCIERFHFAFTSVSSKSSSGGLSQMYASWARDLNVASTRSAIDAVLGSIAKGLQSPNRYPKLADFVAGFSALRYSDVHTKQKKLVQYILRRIADYFSPPGTAFDHDQMTIEHVASQNPSEPSSVSKEHVGMLGNLLWCDSRLQRELGNRPFAAKKEILAKHKIASASDIAAQSQWTNAEIETRTNALAQLAYAKIWTQ